MLVKTYKRYSELESGMKHTQVQQKYASSLSEDSNNGIYLDNKGGLSQSVH